ncbi:alpha/beta fold hydrolase [Tundrisphaera sp. TA3]|uniref:alpha/beta fold hydrolase n=1 Tax=Tundrisphaera sp. TA3 TaxID=3435775 RepID=UPI003EC0E113
MFRKWGAIVLGLAIIAGGGASAGRAEEPNYRRIEDVIYGRKFGTALTLDVFTPVADAKGIGVVLVVSGGWVSGHDAVRPMICQPLLDRGYTVFAVVHGSQPRFTVPEIIPDINRAVRFVRHHAGRYGIDPDRIGITGASAGGHLSLMMGTDGSPGSATAADPVERESSRVQAVACFFPPTDFLNYGKPGNRLVRAEDLGRTFRPAFDFREIDRKTGLSVPIVDPERLKEIAREISPITHVTPDDAPTLIVHGDADPLVPLQQSETFLERLKAAGVPTRLIVKPGYGHGWLTLARDMATFADWFDEHLKPRESPAH